MRDWGKWGAIWAAEFLGNLHKTAKVSTLDTGLQCELVLIACGLAWRVGNEARLEGGWRQSGTLTGCCHWDRRHFVSDLIRGVD